MPSLSPADRDALVDLARRAVAARLGAGAEPETVAAGALLEPRGAFVALEVAGALRGFVGTLAAAGPLATTVAAAARRACADDPRFAPLRAEELASLRVRIAVVGRRRALRAPSDVEPGRDGVSGSTCRRHACCRSYPLRWDALHARAGRR
ncbi:MAG TPA: AMMECR1 domain-containing protein, partial [Anaeromyxobacteraceae bacterium]|nr:AMMECR1 domain-containing protein [Anaeromyxobacteraceae bacterium]